VYAVIKTGGKQYVVKPNQIVKIEKVDVPENGDISFDALLVSDNGNVKFNEGKVRATVLEHEREKKITVFKYKPKKHYQRKMGHRQSFTMIKINEIAV
jgi:large subunit ribosomal protein L21